MSGITSDTATAAREADPGRITGKAMLWLAAVFASLIVVIIYLADTGNLGFAYRLYDFPHGDKVAHVILLGLVTLPATLGMLRVMSGEPRGVALRTAGVIALLITLEEGSQAFLPRRSLDAFDLAASYVGIAGAAWLGYVLRGLILERPKASSSKQGVIS